jgi:hypothetical protein
VLKRPSRDRRLHALSILFAALPLAFALIRAVRTASDFRYLWVALASLGSATALMTVASRPGSARSVAVTLSVGVFLVATTSAVVAALLLGTTLGPGILVVGAAFGFCCAVGSALHVLAGPWNDRTGAFPSR